MPSGFDFEKYAAGSEIYCDKCGATMEPRASYKERCVAKDRLGREVIEIYLECQSCMATFHIGFQDHSIRAWAARRATIRAKLQRLFRIKGPESSIRSLIKEDEKVKSWQMKRKAELEEVYGTGAVGGGLESENEEHDD